MGQQLTYADRELLLQTFDTLKTEWRGTDKHLITDASDWAKHLVPNCGFEHALIRDVTVLSRYLTTHNTSEDLADIARGGLLYVVQANQHEPSRLRHFDLLDDAFMTSYAVHEIRIRLGEKAIYNPPSLTSEEKNAAEDMFLDLTKTSTIDDDDLIQQSKSIGKELGILATCGFFKRLQRNIDFLTSVIKNLEYNQEQLSYARAALNYLICENDIINDRLGIVGYLDDNFIVQTAVDMIEPSRDPWLDILDKAVGAWPFLNIMVINDGSGGRPLSEYMIINSALSCSQLRGKHSNSTILIVPFSGPIPFLLGFISTLGLIQQSGKPNVTEKSFWPGQKVLVDHYAIAEFAGIKEINGRRLFGLTQYRHQRGQQLSSTHYWPLSDLRRLVPVDSLRATRGQLDHSLKRTEAALPALDYIFNATKTAHLSAIAKRILVVTPVAQAHDLAKRLQLYDHQLKDVIPMGHLVGDEVKSWSNRFGQQNPLLIFASDLDVACVYAEKQLGSIENVILDLSGRNSNKYASLVELQHLSCQTLIVSPERSANTLPIGNDNSTGVWEWDTRDFSSLLWPLDPNEISGPISCYEHRLNSNTSTVPQVRNIDCSLADEVFESVRYLKSIIIERGEESLAELDEIIVLAFRLTSRLLRSATSMMEGFPSFNQIEHDLQRLCNIRRESRFLSKSEQIAATAFENLFQQFWGKLRKSNPKATEIKEILHTQPELAVISPDTRTIHDLLLEYGNGKNQIISDYIDTDRVDFHGAIIPGWFRKDHMERLLIPPLTQPLILILYNIEQRWYAEFSRERQKSRYERGQLSKRSKVFPGIQRLGEKPIELPPSIKKVNNTSFRELESIYAHIRDVQRKNAYFTAKSDGIEPVVSARLVLFEGGTHAFLRESYKAIVVTDLFDASVEETENENLEVRHKTLQDLKLNDALLFHRRSDRDVIRIVADEELEDGVRDTATLWQKVLIQYAKQSHLSVKNVWQRLQNNGCPLKLQTIRGWMDDNDMIAPRQYERDVPIIAMVTDDPQLKSQINRVLDDIRIVFGAHQRASNKLARQVLRRAVEILKEEHNQSNLIELETDVVMVRIAEIDDKDSQVRVSIVNRLLEPDQWYA